MHIHSRALLTLKQKTSIFNLLYYSHIQLVVAAMIITASINVIVTGNITWGAVSVVGLSTYLTYSIDNLIDWKKDKLNYQNEVLLIKKYHKFTYFLIGLCLLGILLIILSTSTAFMIGMALLGSSVVISTARLTAYRKLNSRNPETFYGFILNRIFISLVWTNVSVFLPLWYVGLPINSQAWSAFIYTWQLIFIYAVLWRLEKTEGSLRERIVASPLWTVLKVLSITAGLWPVYSVLVGRFPIQNLFNMLPPLAILILLNRWPASWEKARKQIFLFTLCLVICGLFTMIMHLIFK